ncbi:hypothetical protein JMUB7516_27570 [Staphylococcus aureus]
MYKRQLQEDIVADQISMEEYLDPFTGEKNKNTHLTLPTILLV